MGVRTSDAHPRVLPGLTCNLPAEPSCCPGVSTCVSLFFLFPPPPNPKDLEGVPPSKKMKLEASQQNSEEM